MTPEGIQPRISRIDTDEKKQSRALCLDKPSGGAFSNPFTSQLARDSENTSPTRSASSPAFALATRPSSPEGTGLRLACQAGRCFGKASESLLASVFSEQLRHSCNESNLGFRGYKLVRLHPWKSCHPWLK